MLSDTTRNRLARALASRPAAEELANRLAGLSTGKVFFVHADDGAGTNNRGADSTSRTGQNPDEPFATLDYAIGKCSASDGDIIVLMPGHAETTTAIAADVAGIFIIGMGSGRLKPALTATTAATDLLNVSAANVYIENVRFVGAASGNTALLDVAAADFCAFNCVFEPLATPLKTITIASGHRGKLLNCKFIVTANGPDIAIDIESSGSDFWEVIGCDFNASGIGWDDGVIRANADAAVGWRIKNCSFVGCDTLAIDFNSSGGASTCDGVVEDCTFVATAALTSIEDILDVGRYVFKECYAHDFTNLTTAAARVPIGTVS